MRFSALLLVTIAACQETVSESEQGAYAVCGMSSWEQHRTELEIWAKTAYADCGPIFGALKHTATKLLLYKRTATENADCSITYSNEQVFRTDHANHGTAPEASPTKLCSRYQFPSDGSWEDVLPGTTSMSSLKYEAGSQCDECPVPFLSFDTAEDCAQQGCDCPDGEACACDKFESSPACVKLAMLAANVCGLVERFQNSVVCNDLTQLTKWAWDGAYCDPSQFEGCFDGPALFYGSLSCF